MNDHRDCGEPRQYQHSFFSFLRFFLAYGAALLLAFAAPFFVGLLAGHLWGFLVALINTVLYVWFGVRQTMATSTRAIWIVGIAFLLFVAGFEFAQMSR